MVPGQRICFSSLDTSFSRCDFLTKLIYYTDTLTLTNCVIRVINSNLKVRSHLFSEFGGVVFL